MVCMWLQTAECMFAIKKEKKKSTICSYHHIVIHVPHVVDVHGNFSSTAPVPRSTCRRYWTLTSWGELIIGTVGLPVDTIDNVMKLKSVDLIILF